MGVVDPPAVDPPTFVAFESTPTRPLAISTDGLRLFAANAVGGHLSIFSLADPSLPVLLGEVRVGLEPVSVVERVPGEVWVANQLSDTVSVVDTEAGRVIDVLVVGDQPSDIAFAGGRAFVTAATEDRVVVFDAVTRVEVGSVAIPGEEPRTLLAIGDRVWALVRRSGNRTTILPHELAPSPPAPTDPLLPLPPRTGLIVDIEDPLWRDSFSYELPDEDLFAIDAHSLAIVERVRGVATTNYDVIHDPVGARLIVAGTEARNIERFEPTLRGRAVESRLTSVDAIFGEVEKVFDLNEAIEAGGVENSAGLATALAEPTGLAVDPLSRRVFVAAQGSDRIGVLDADTGDILDTIDLSAPSDGTLARRGPRALALHPGGDRLYTFNRLSASISVLSTADGSVVREFPIGTHDPMPADARNGRKFLYDASLSGNGTQSCALCHVDAETDGLAWDLGDPGGSMVEVPFELTIPSGDPADFPALHPMKGPMVTQAFRGLGEPLHWRGDRMAFEDFNEAFDALMGGAPLADEEMTLFADWARSVVHPPNPHQPLDRSLSLEPLEASPALGAELFLVTQEAGSSCVDCHALPTTTNGLVAELAGSSPQPSRVAPFLDYYRKADFDPEATGPLKLGFGRFRDGAIGDLVELEPLLPGLFGSQTGGSPHIDAYLEQIDTGTAPSVGVQVPLDGTSVVTAEFQELRDLMLERALLGEIELVAHGRHGANRGALLFDAPTLEWIVDTSNGPDWTTEALEAAAELGEVELIWTAVPHGTGRSMSVDRDGDGVLDGDLAPTVVEGASPAGCTDLPTITTTAPARIGQELFAVRVDGLSPGALGRLFVADAPGSATLGQVELAVPLTAPSVDFVADGRGTAAIALPLPEEPSSVGQTLRFQAVVSSPCSGGLAATEAIEVTLAP